MIKISDEIKKACYAGGYFKRYTFVFDTFTLDASVIHTESVTIHEAICEDAELKLGGCLASSCEFEVSETVTDSISLNGLRFRAYLHLYEENTEPHLTDDDNEDWAIGREVGVIPMGVYNVRSVEMVDDADYKKITAYDDLYDWNVDVSEWYNNTFPSNITSVVYTDVNGKVIDASKGVPSGATKQTIMKSETVPVAVMRNALLQHLMSLNGKFDSATYQQIISKSYLNDTAMITKTLQTSDSGSVMGVDLLRYFCELAGGFGRINRYGIFEILSLGQGSGLYPEENLYPEDNRGADYNLYPEDNFVYLGGDSEDGSSPDFISTHYEEFNAQTVTSVGFCVRRLTETDGVQLVENGNARIVSYPDSQGDNPYITSNPLILDMSDSEVRQVAMNIYSQLSGIVYRPNTTVLQGVPYYEPGDYYNVTKKISFESFVFSRTLTGIQGLRDEFTANGLEIRENNITVYDSAYTSMAEDYEKVQEIEEINNTIEDSEVNIESVNEYNAGDLIRTVSGTSIEWDTNKYRIDEFGRGEPELSYRTKTIKVAPGYMNGHFIASVEGLPDVYSLSENDFAYYFFDSTTGWLYEPNRKVMYDTYGQPDNHRWWRTLGKSTSTREEKYFDYDISDVGKTYLDEDTGKLYRLVGTNLSSANPQFRWDFIAQLEKVTVQLQTTISQTAEEIRLEASKTYATDSYVKAQFSVTAEQISSEVEARKGDTETLKSSIVQTASQIESSVSKNSDTWDTVGYNIIARGYGVDSSSYKDYASNSLLRGGYYLDEQTGYLYWVTSSYWITQGQMIRLRFYYSRSLTRTTVNLSSRITQTEESITQEVKDRRNDTDSLTSKIEQTAEHIEMNVAKSADVWDTTGYNIIARGYGVDSSSYKDYASNQLLSGGYYLDEQTGYLYWVYNSSWVTQGSIIRLNFYYYTRTTKKTENLSSRIRQTPHSISLSVDNDTNGTTTGMTIKLKDENGNDLPSTVQSITFHGIVGFYDLANNNNYTKIDGANITTGTIKVDQIESNSNSTLAFSSSGGVRVGPSDGAHTGISYNTIETGFVKSYNYQTPLTIGGWSGYGNATNIYAYDKILIQPGSANYNSGTVDIECTNGDVKLNSKNLYAYALRKDKGSTKANVMIGSADRLRETSESSRRYKRDITTDIREELDPHKLLDLPMSQYKYKTDYLTDVTDPRYDVDIVGFIAEDVAEHYPVACDFNEYGEANDWNERYIVPPLLSLVQELYKRVETLETEIKELKGGN